MILYNTTFAVDKATESALTDFIKSVYIPAALEAGMKSPVLSKMRPVDDGGEDTAVSMALQVLAPSHSIFEAFTDTVVPRIFAAMPEELACAIQVFCTELDVLYAPATDGKSC